MSPRLNHDKNSFFRPGRSIFRRSRAVSADTKVATFDELLFALAEKRVQITLDADIVVEQNILINYDVAINLGGHSLISDESRTDARVLDIRRGEVIITGEGRIFAMGKDSAAIRIFGAISTGVSDYSKLIVDDKVHLYAPEGCGILVAANLGAAYAASVRFAGEIVARSGISVASGVRGTEGALPEIVVRSGAEIIADDKTGAALDASGLASWYIDSAKLIGANGVHLCSGYFSFVNSQIISDGATFLLDAESSTENLEVTIDGGTYFSESHLVFAGTPRTRETFIIKNGDFCGQWGIVTADHVKSINATKANFVTNVEEFMPLLTPETPEASEISETLEDATLTADTFELDETSPALDFSFMTTPDDPVKEPKSLKFTTEPEPTSAASDTLNLPITAIESKIDHIIAEESKSETTSIKFAAPEEIPLAPAPSLSDFLKPPKPLKFTPDFHTLPPVVKEEQGTMSVTDSAEPAQPVYDETLQVFHTPNVTEVKKPNSATDTLAANAIKSEVKPTPTFRAPAVTVKPFKPLTTRVAGVTSRLGSAIRRPAPVNNYSTLSLPLSSPNYEEVVNEPEENLALPTVAPSRKVDTTHHLVSLSDLELDQLFDIDNDISRLVREYWSARPILIDESAPVHFSAAALRKCKVKHMREPKIRNESIAKSLFAGLQAGLNVFRETRAQLRI